VPAVTIFDSRDEVPENLRDKASEVEGKFHLPADALLGNYNEVLAEKKRTGEELKRLKAEADKFKDIDPARARAALQALEEAEAEKQKVQGDWDAREKALKTGFETRESEYKTQLQEREQALDRVVIADELARTAADPEVDGEAVLLQPFVAPLVRRKGLTDYEILDAEGNVRYDSDGKPLRMKALLLELRAQPSFERLFNAPNTGGSGAPSSHAGGGGGTPKGTRRGQMSTSQAAQYIAKHGREAYLKLPV
jgi:hypothetical protein